MTATGGRLGAWRLPEVPAEVMATWWRAFRSQGFHLAHSPIYAQALDRSRNDGQVWVSCDSGRIGAFLVVDSLATSIFPGIGWVSWASTKPSGLEALAGALLAASITDAVYFPLLFRAIGTDLLTGAVTWPRSPCPVICWGDQGATLWNRVRKRLSKRADRRRQRFERSGLVCRSLAGDRAATAVEAVERGSWKALAGQAMHQRDGQLGLYRSLIRSGAVRVRAVLDGRFPVAFRLDSKVGSRVTCLKWSYHDGYRSLSPGFYLLTVDLVRSWAGTDVQVIDLFGSPDTLKAAVQTAVVERYDMAWPPGQLVTGLRQERQAHEERVRRAYDTGVGIRHVYAGGSR